MTTVKFPYISWLCRQVVTPGEQAEMKNFTTTAHKLQDG